MKTAGVWETWEEVAHNSQHWLQYALWPLDAAVSHRALTARQASHRHPFKGSHYSKRHKNVTSVFPLNWASTHFFSKCQAVYFFLKDLPDFSCQFLLERLWFLPSNLHVSVTARRCRDKSVCLLVILDVAVVVMSTICIFMIPLFLPQVRVLRTRLPGGELPGNLHRQPPVRPHLLRRRSTEGPWKLHESAAEDWRHSGDAHRGSGKNQQPGRRWCCCTKTRTAPQKHSQTLEGARKPNLVLTCRTGYATCT